MKKQTTFMIGLTLALAVCFASVASAQSTIRAEASAYAETETGGGLGKGISDMVHDILGESEEPEPAAAPSATMMMNANEAADALIAPQIQTMSFKAETSPSATARAPMTDADLRAYIVGLVRENGRIQLIDSTENRVRITYAIPVKVLGFVRASLPMTVNVRASGSTEVSYPWYARAAKGIPADFRVRVAERLEPLNISESFSLDDQHMIIDAVYAALADEFEPSSIVNR